MKRRDFIKSMTVAGLATAYPLRSVAGRHSEYFSLHPFVEQHPDAVFIMRTQVPDKHDNTAKRQAAAEFGASVFVPTDAEHGFSASTRVAMKPNLTGYNKNAPRDSKMGIVTDPYFMEGLIESMKSLGLAGRQFHIREVNGEDLQEDNGYADMAKRTGVDHFVKGTKVTRIDPELVVWRDNPDGIYFSKIPYLWPINAADTFLLNIAKFKAHGMGMTLCAKNLQGSIAASYQQHCNRLDDGMSIDDQHIQPSAITTIQENYNRHLADNIPRWDKPGRGGGLWQETWATRCLDNNSVTRPELHIIEGIYGHDGNFTSGPHDGKPKDFMSNIIIFGKNPFHVDVIGHWLGVHEPGNFGLLHMAIERGQSRFLNPRDIPLYEWFSDGSASLTPLDQFERTLLLTYYLQRDYGGQNEPYWHLVDEPFDYTSVKVDGKPPIKPQTFALAQNYPNPFNASTTISFTLPRAGNARLEVYDARGRIVDIVADRFFGAGLHQVLWDASGVPSGTYVCRCLYSGYTRMSKMTVVK